jgi:hypothetical protein
VLALASPRAGAGELEDLGLPPELIQPPSWDHDVSVRLRGGYDDNVLLSSFSPVGNAFLGADLEATVWHALGPRSTFETFASGEYQHFIASTNVHDEGNAFALLQLKHEVTDAWQVRGSFEYLYQDEILDVSATEPTLEVTRVQGDTFNLCAALRRQLGVGWLELEVPAEWQLFRSPLDDTRRLAPRLSGSLPLGRRDEFTLSYAYARTWYDTEEERTTAGVPIPGTRRQMDDQEARLGWKHTWDAARHWQTTARVSGHWSADHGSGYYDYARPQGFLQVRYRGGGWELSADGRYAYYHYPVQTVSATDPDLRWRSEVAANLAVERSLTSWLKVFVQYAYDRTFGDRPTDAYSVNTVSAGLNFEF